MLIHDVFIHTLIFLVKFAIFANQAAQKFWTWCFSLTLYTEYKAIQVLDT